MPDSIDHRRLIAAINAEIGSALGRRYDDLRLRDLTLPQLMALHRLLRDLSDELIRPFRRAQRRRH
jgi:hypothetical protein